MQMATFCPIHTVPINRKPYPGLPERLKGVFVERRYNSRQEQGLTETFTMRTQNTPTQSRECPCPHLVGYGDGLDASV